MALKLVPPKPEPTDRTSRIRKRVKEMDKPPEMIQCPRCGGREVIESKTGVMFSRSKTSGGTKALLCVLCLMRGERVEII